MPISKRAVLRTGFGLTTGLLVLSTVIAISIQESFSKRSVQIHRHYVQKQELLTSLRRTLWLAGIATRDYFINPANDGAEQYISQLGSLRADVDRLMESLKRTGESAAEIAELESRFTDLWRTLREPANFTLGNKAKYDFIQREVVPKRDGASRILRELEKANHSSLAESEKQFTFTRESAARTLVLVLGACLLAGVVVAQISLRYSDHLERRSAAQLEEVSVAKQELERLSARLMEIQEEERTRLSRELHDEIIQNLAVLKMEITRVTNTKNLPPAEVRHTLLRARELADRTVQTVRNISLLLRPSLLDDLGLVPALQWLAEDYRMRTGTPCAFEDSNVGGHLSGALTTCVYRVAQEALRNCEKHSFASQVRLAVHQANNVLTLQIVDNGIGLADSGKRSFGRLGLLGMKERAASVGGELSIVSSKGNGLTVQLTIPIDGWHARHSPAASTETSFT